MKVLVLENMDHLDDEISAYLTKEHAKDKVNVIHNVSKCETLQEELAKCDAIVIQSTFNDTNQLEFFLDVLPKFKNIKELRVIYTYNNPSDNNQFLQFLNIKARKLDIYDKILKFIDHIRLSEVLCKTILLEKGEYFNKTDVLYDIVPIYHNKKEDVIWHERMPIIDKTGLKYYKKETIKDDHITLKIEKKDFNAFSEMMSETRAMIEHQKESCELHDYGDSEVLIKEKTAWLNLLDKYKF